MATCFSGARQSKHSPGCVCAPAVYRHLRAELRDSAGAARRSRLCLPPPAFDSNQPWDNDMQESCAPAMLILHIREAPRRGCMWAEPYGRWQLLPGWHSRAAAAPDASHSLTLRSSTEFPAELEVPSPSTHPGREDPPAAQRCELFWEKPLHSGARPAPEAAPGSSRLELLRDEAPARGTPAARGCALAGSPEPGKALGTWGVWMEETNGMLAPGAAAGHQDTPSSSAPTCGSTCTQHWALLALSTALSPN